MGERGGEGSSGALELAACRETKGPPPLTRAARRCLPPRWPSPDSLPGTPAWAPAWKKGSWGRPHAQGLPQGVMRAGLYRNVPSQQSAGGGMSERGQLKMAFLRCGGGSWRIPGKEAHSGTRLPAASAPRLARQLGTPRDSSSGQLAAIGSPREAPRPNPPPRPLAPLSPRLGSMLSPPSSPVLLTLVMDPGGEVRPSPAVGVFEIGRGERVEFDLFHQERSWHGFWTRP